MAESSIIVYIIVILVVVFFALVLQKLYQRRLRREGIRNSTDSIPHYDWKKHNLPELNERWENYGSKYSEFEEFCKKMYKRIK